MQEAETTNALHALNLRVIKFARKKKEDWRVHSQHAKKRIKFLKKKYFNEAIAKEE